MTREMTESVSKIGHQYKLGYSVPKARSFSTNKTRQKTKSVEIHIALLSSEGRL